MSRQHTPNTWIARLTRWGFVGCLAVGPAWFAIGQDAQPSDAESDTQVGTEVQGDSDEGSPDPLAISEEAAAAELASANSLLAELDALLSGEADLPEGVSVRSRLAALATRSELLANSAMSSEAIVLLLRCQAQVNAILANSAADTKMRDRRLASLRSAARKLSEFKPQGLGPESDYWLLLADLADASQFAASSVTRQSLSEQLLRAYIDNYDKTPIAKEFVTDARLSLASLLDRRGDQAGAVELLKSLKGLPDDGPRFAEAKRLYDSAQRIGMPVSFEGVTTRLEVWNLADNLGQPVLLHIYADAAKASTDMIAQISKAIVARSISGFKIVSLRVGEPQPDAPTTPWPTLPITLEPGGVLDRMGVEALPTLAWIDADGKLASIGHTLAVLDQMPSAAGNPLEQGESNEEPVQTQPSIEPKDADGSEADAAEPGSREPEP